MTALVVDASVAIKWLVGEDGSDAALGVLHRSVSAWHTTSNLIAEALSLACELNHPVYDCHYLVLARQLETKCITADESLLAKAGATGLIAGLADWKM